LLPLPSHPLARWTRDGMIGTAPPVPHLSFRTPVTLMTKRSAPNVSGFRLKINLIHAEGRSMRTAGIAIEGLARPLKKEQLPVTDGSLHPHLQAKISELTFTGDGTPNLASWERFVTSVNRGYCQLEHRDQDTFDAKRGWASFENLFQVSPIPIMEQDYTRLEAWMDDLRSQGVTDIRDYLGDDIEAIKALAPMITIVAANPAALRAVGLPSEDLIGPIDPMIVNAGSHPGWLVQLEAVWNGNPVARASIEASTADGRHYDAESILSAPVVDGVPDFSRAVFTLIDVTDHRNEERRMAEVLQSKDAFLASVSHEIRTPLTGILGFAQMLDAKEENLDDADRELMVSLIVQQAQEVASLVEDLLVMARTEMGQIEIVEATVDVDVELRHTLKAGGPSTVDVVIRSQVGSSLALGDPLRIRQILRNLLTNAERYGGSNVHVTITTDHGRVVVAVADDGLGLPTGEWERIFEPYHRAHESLGRPGSIGIGLAISRQLAELMGGTLDYHHHLGHSVFRLALRAAPA